MSGRNAFLTAFLSFLFLLSALRLAAFALEFGNESLQKDFSAYYTAGEALNAGLSPYKTYVTRTPPIWDGVMFYTHSRFSYPPPAAILFRPWAHLSYATAKRLWMVFTIICAALALMLSVKIIGLNMTARKYLLIGIFALTFHPLLAHLERGQVDATTLLLITAGVWFLIKGKSGEWMLGILFSFATLLKLHCVFLLPFLVLRKRWRAAGGFLAGIGVLILVSLLVNGTDVSKEYVFERFPTMSRNGTDQGSKEQRLPVDLAVSLLHRTPEGMRIKDGRTYKLDSFAFAYSGTVVRVLQELLKGRGIAVSHQTLLALGTLSYFIILTAWLQRKCGKEAAFKRPVEEYLYWQAAFVIVLLAAPTTFVMNTVWLLPLSAVVLRFFEQDAGKRTVWLLALACGLFLVWMPDAYGFQLLIPPWGQSGFEYKYVAGELLILTGLMGMLYGAPQSFAEHPHNAR